MLVRVILLLLPLVASFLHVKIHDARLVEHVSPGEVRYNRTVIDVLGGATHLRYHAKFRPGFVPLASNPYILGYSCSFEDLPSGDGLLTLDVSDVRAIEAWVPGGLTHFSGLEGGSCQDPSLEHASPHFFRSLTSVREIEWRSLPGGSTMSSAASLEGVPFSELPAGVPARVTYLTKAASYAEAFEFVEVMHQRSPGPREEEIAELYASNATFRRGLLTLHHLKELHNEDPDAFRGLVARRELGASWSSFDYVTVVTTVTATANAFDSFQTAVSVASSIPLPLPFSATSAGLLGLQVDQTSSARSSYAWNTAQKDFTLVDFKGAVSASLEAAMATEPLFLSPGGGSYASFAKTKLDQVVCTACYATFALNFKVYLKMTNRVLETLDLTISGVTESAINVMINYPLASSTRGARVFPWSVGQQLSPLARYSLPSISIPIGSYGVIPIGLQAAIDLNVTTVGSTGRLAGLGFSAAGSLILHASYDYTRTANGGWTAFADSKITYSPSFGYANTGSMGIGAHVAPSYTFFVVPYNQVSLQFSITPHVDVTVDPDQSCPSNALQNPVAPSFELLGSFSAPSLSPLLQALGATNGGGASQALLTLPLLFGQTADRPIPAFDCLDRFPLSDSKEAVFYYAKMSGVVAASNAAAWVLDASDPCNVDCGVGIVRNVWTCRNSTSGLAINPAVCALSASMPPAQVPCEAMEGSACQYYEGDGIFSPTYSMDLGVQTLSRLSIGQSLPFGTSIVWQHLLNPSMEGVSAELQLTGAGSAWLSMETPNTTVAKEGSQDLTRTGVSNATLFIDATSDDISPFDLINITVTSQALALSNSAPGNATFYLHITAFYSLSESTPLTVTLDANGTAYLRFIPAPTASAIVVSTESGDGVSTSEPAVYISYSYNGWPSPTSFDFFTLNSSSGMGSSNGVVIEEADFHVNEWYLILLVGEPGALVTVFANSFLPLTQGVEQSATVHGGSLVYFRATCAILNDRLSIQTTSLVGGVNVYVSSSPFKNRPRFAGNASDADAATFLCPSCKWRSEETGLTQGTNALTITSLDSQWGSVFYVAVGGPFFSLFRITAESYEDLDQGVAIQRMELPGEFVYFSGSPPSADDIGTTFNLNVMLDAQSPGSIKVLAGAESVFFPTVTEYAAGLRSPSLIGGESYQAQSPYLPGSIISRRMTVGILVDPHGVTAASYAASMNQQDSAAAAARRLDTAASGSGGGGALLRGGASAPVPADAPSTKEESRTPSAGSAPRALLSAPSAPAVVDPFLLFLSLRAPNITAPLFVHGGATNPQWIPVADCSPSSPVDPARVCWNGTRRAGEETYFRIRVPPRVDLTVSVFSTTGGDAPYALAASADEPPYYSTDTSSSLSPLMTADFHNCHYITRNFYFVVETNNADKSDGAFTVTVSGSQAAGFCPSAAWAVGAFSECSEECGDGVRTRAVTCLDDFGATLDDSFCPAALRPTASQSCSTGPCIWVASPWTSCSAPCGGGSSLRSTACQNNASMPVSVQHCANETRPVEVVGCNLGACPPALWLTSEWSPCSLDCGSGGFSARVVQCVNGSTAPAFTPLPDNKLCPGSMPDTYASCSNGPCAPSTFELVYFDTTLLASGNVANVPELATGANAYFTMEVPANVEGVCIVVAPSSSASEDCSAGLEQVYASCVSSMNACYANAMRTAKLAAWTAAPGGLASSLQAPSYIHPKDWLKNETYVSPPGACDCFAIAQECLNHTRCAVQGARADIAGLCHKSSTCNALGAGAVLSGGSSTSLHCDAHLFDAAPADAYELLIRASPVSLSSPSSNPTAPPSSGVPSRWGGMPSDVSGLQTLLLYGDDFAQSTLAAGGGLLISLTNLASPMQAILSASFLSSFPVSVSGSLIDSGPIPASLIRAGGGTLRYTLSCDIFIDPLVPLSQRFSTSLNVSDFAADFGRRASANLIAIGFLASMTQTRGFNDVARPLLLAPNAASFATFSLSMLSLSVTLPPIPDYDPLSDESILLSIPSLLLRSGMTTLIPSAQITILSDRTYCAAEAWSAWSVCSSSICEDGTQSRSRQVALTGAGPLPGEISSLCPPTLEVRSCNPCDPCSGVRCLYGGVCASGICACPPAFSGPDCSVPEAISSVAFYTASPWSECSARCGTNGGITNRALQCMAGRLNSTAAAASVCSSSIPATPLSERSCNVQSCEADALYILATIDLSGILQSVAFAPAGSFDVVQVDAIAASFAAELETLLAAPNRITITHSFDNSSLVQAAAAILLDVTLSISPKSSSQSSSGQQYNGSSEAFNVDLGLSLSDILLILMDYANKPGSPLFSSGTYMKRAKWQSSSYIYFADANASATMQGPVIEYVSPKVVAAQASPSTWVPLTIGLVSFLVVAVVFVLTGSFTFFLCKGAPKGEARGSRTSDSNSASAAGLDSAENGLHFLFPALDPALTTFQHSHTLASPSSARENVQRESAPPVSVQQMSVESPVSRTLIPLVDSSPENAASLPSSSARRVELPPTEVRATSQMQINVEAAAIVGDAATISGSSTNTSTTPTPSLSLDEDPRKARSLRHINFVGQLTSAISSSRRTLPSGSFSSLNESLPTGGTATQESVPQAALPSNSSTGLIEALPAGGTAATQQESVPQSEVPSSGSASLAATLESETIAEKNESASLSSQVHQEISSEAPQTLPEVVEVSKIVSEEAVATVAPPSLATADAAAFTSSNSSATDPPHPTSVSKVSLISLAAQLKTKSAAVPTFKKQDRFEKIRALLAKK